MLVFAQLFTNYNNKSMHMGTADELNVEYGVAVELNSTSVKTYTLHISNRLGMQNCNRSGILVYSTSSKLLKYCIKDIKFLVKIKMDIECY